MKKPGNFISDHPLRYLLNLGSSLKGHDATIETQGLDVF
jgi:hypothetical protein